MMNATVQKQLLEDLESEEAELVAEIDRLTARGIYGTKVEMARNKRVAELGRRVDSLDLQLRESEARCSMDGSGEPGPIGRWLREFDDVGNWLMVPNSASDRPLDESNCHHHNSTMNANRRRLRDAKSELADVEAEADKPDPVPELQQRLKRVRMGIARFSKE